MSTDPQDRILELLHERITVTPYDGRWPTMYAEEEAFLRNALPKDLVIRGGMNISAEEIEGLLLACPGVREVAVVGVPDALMGEKVCACVTPHDGHTLALEDIVQYLRAERHVAAYKLPEFLLSMPSLPRNPVGKILKTELRAQARARYAPSQGDAA